MYDIIPFATRTSRFALTRIGSVDRDERQIVGTNMKNTTTASPIESMDKKQKISFDNADRLDSWKEIACYLNRNVRTVQRWEASESMPVHRHLHAKSGSVHAFRSELDAWRRDRSYCSPPARDDIRRSEMGPINDKEQLLHTVLEAILIQLTAQSTSATNIAFRPRVAKIVRSLASVKEL